MPFDLPSIKSWFTNASSAKPEGDTPPQSRARNANPLPNASEIKNQQSQSSQGSPRASRSSIGAPNIPVEPEKKSWIGRLFSKNIYKKTDTSASNDVSPVMFRNPNSPATTASTSNLNAKFDSDTPKSIQEFAKSTLELVNHYPFLAQNYAKTFANLKKEYSSDKALNEIQQHISKAVQDQKSSTKRFLLGDELNKLHDEVLDGGKPPPFSEEVALGILDGLNEHGDAFLNAEYISQSNTSKVTTLGGQELEIPLEMNTTFRRRVKPENPFKPTLQIIQHAFPFNPEIQARCGMLLTK